MSLISTDRTRIVNVVRYCPKEWSIIAEDFNVSYMMWMIFFSLKSTHFLYVVHLWLWHHLFNTIVFLSQIINCEFSLDKVYSDCWDKDVMEYFLYDKYYYFASIYGTLLEPCQKNILSDMTNCASKWLRSHFQASKKRQLRTPRLLLAAIGPIVVVPSARHPSDLFTFLPPSYFKSGYCPETSRLPVLLMEVQLM